MIPKTRLALATIAFPVPRSFVGKSSGVITYKTPYMTLLVKLYVQFQPKRALDVRAVVETSIKTPVRAVFFCKYIKTKGYVMSTHTGGNGKSTAPAKDRKFHHISCQKRTRNADHAENNLLREK